MYKVMTYAAVVFQVLSSDIDETESGGGNTSERTEQFCQIFGSAPQGYSEGSLASGQYLKLRGSPPVHIKVAQARNFWAPRAVR